MCKGDRGKCVSGANSVSLGKLRGLMRVSSIFPMLKNGETTLPPRPSSRLARAGFGKIRENLKNALDVQNIWIIIKASYPLTAKNTKGNKISIWSTKQQRTKDRNHF